MNTVVYASIQIFHFLKEVWQKGEFSPCARMFVSQHKMAWDTFKNIISIFILGFQSLVPPGPQRTM